MEMWTWGYGGTWGHKDVGIRRNMGTWGDIGTQGHKDMEIWGDNDGEGVALMEMWMWGYGGTWGGIDGDGVSWAQRCRVTLSL